MFGHKAQTPCDNWLGLNNYDLDESMSKISWLQEHQKLMEAANPHALKSIKKSAEQSALRTRGNELSTPKDNLVLLGINLKVVRKSKTILKIKNLWW